MDVVDIFRRLEYFLPIVANALAAAAKFVWMREGIVNPEAAKWQKDTGSMWWWIFV